MIIQMTNKEFQELRKFIISLDHPKVTKSFNEVFSKDPSGGVKGFVNPLTKDIIVEVPESLATEVEKVFVDHGTSLGKLIRGGVSIKSAPKWISTLKGILDNVIDAITYR